MSHMDILNHSFKSKIGAIVFAFVFCVFFFPSTADFAVKIPIRDKRALHTYCNARATEKRSISMCGFKHTINNRCYPTATRLPLTALEQKQMLRKAHRLPH